MSAFSIPSIDSLIHRAKAHTSMDDSFERKPSFSFYPPLYVTPPIQPPRPPFPPVSPSPSPYVVNFKRRGPVQCTTVHNYVDGGQVQSVGAHSHGNHDGLNLQQQNTIDEKVVNESAGHGYVYEATDVLDSNLDHFNYENDVNARSSQGPSRISTTSEEFFDAPDAPLDDAASEDETYLNSKRRMGKSAEKLTPCLKEEIARRTKAEQSLALLQRRWNEMAKIRASIGYSLPSGQATLDVEGETEQDLSEQFSEKLVVARLVSGAIASAAVRAAKGEEFESMLAGKNREISRLWDKLQYLELVNREMFQRNQEVIEIAQRRRRRRRKRQKWALGCFCATFCIGTAGLLCYKFLPWDRAGTWTKLSKTDSILCDVCST